jgi:manganese-dependent ADP-ribose/CDP-alcohol diphosphatase
MERKSIACLLALLALSCRSTTTEDPDRASVRFGLVADIQYADKDTAGERRYREALDGWKACVVAWNEDDLDFAVQLGDLIDGREELADTRRDMNRVLGVTAGLHLRLYHVVGNHCLVLPREELLARLRLERASYSFSVNGWRFVVLDTQAISTFGWSPGSAPHEAAVEYLGEHAEEPNAKSWNGAVGEIQLEWLGAELEAAREAEERVIVFAHAPILEAASTPSHLAWDHAEVAAFLAGQPGVMAYFSGHDHAGGYAQAAGIHFVGVQGMVEADPAPDGLGAFAVVELYDDRIEVLGVGGVTPRTLVLER